MGEVERCLQVSIDGFFLKKLNRVLEQTDVGVLFVNDLKIQIILRDTSIKFHLLDAQISNI